jgi:superfamily II DNA/RNA helicase
MQFNEFALRPEILRAVEEAGYQHPTPIQEQAIPIMLEGRDLLGIAQTGTGKTAAFVLPMIERLSSGQAKARMPRSLILSPVRELATQTADYFETYGKYVKLNMALLIGGVSLDEQSKKLERGVDVLIATPGRLLDQFERGRVLLGGVTLLVIDEADRMLDMGFIPDVERIVRLLTRRQQTMMFSATMPKEIRRLAAAFLDDPAEVQATPPATAAVGIEDHLTIVPPRQKFKALRRLIDTLDVSKAIIFCNRKREVSSLRRQLERAGLNARDIHGDLDQAQRTQALEAFKRGEIDFLVATDVAARGLDIAMLPCVINYDVPTHADDYIHRIGRTGRAGQEGRAFTLALPEDGKFVDAITRLTGKAISRLPLEGFDGGELVEDGRLRRRRSTRSDAEVVQTMAAEPQIEQPVAPSVVEASSEDEAPCEEETPRRARRSRRSRGGGRRGEEAAPRQVEAEAVERAPAVAADQAPDHEPDRRRRGGRGQGPDPEPVVGMGDHVPSFMLRPVPAALLARRTGSDDVGAA